MRVSRASYYCCIFSGVLEFCTCHVFRSLSAFTFGTSFISAMTMASQRKLSFFFLWWVHARTRRLPTASRREVVSLFVLSYRSCCSLTWRRCVLLVLHIYLFCLAQTQISFRPHPNHSLGPLLPRVPPVLPYLPHLWSSRPRATHVARRKRNGVPSYHPHPHHRDCDRRHAAHRRSCSVA